MTVAAGYEDLTYFGRGPDENYIDRKTASKIGLYSSTVSEQFITKYMKPQENGNRTDVRWTALTNSEGVGLMVSTDGTVESSALHVKAEDINKSTSNYPYNNVTYRHSTEVPMEEVTYWTFDVMQRGVSNTAFFNQIPLEGFYPTTRQNADGSYNTYAETLRITPVTGDMDETDKMEVSRLGFTAEYGPQTFTVRFETDGGTAVRNQTVEAGGKVAEPTAPQKEGYTFDGWYIDADLTEFWDFDAAVTGDMTLYAGWAINIYTVTFHFNNGSDSQAVEVAHGNTVTEPDEPAREDYTFDGWFTDAACTQPYDFGAAVTGDLTLYAGWTEIPVDPDSYIVTFVSNGGTPVPSQTIEAGGTVTKPADPTRDGYTFDGWFTDAACTQPYDFGAAVTGILTLYAGWTEISVEPETYTVSFVSNGGTAVPSQTIEAGGTVTRPADPTRSGYTFDGWFTDAACTRPYDFGAAVTGNLTLYAGWTAAPAEAETYTVTFDSQGGSTVASITVEEGGTISAPAEPTRAGYIFTGWFTDAACTQPYDFGAAVTADLTLYAGWAAEPGKNIDVDTWEDGTVVTTIEDEETGDKTVIVQQPNGTEAVVDVPAEGEITAEIKLGEGVDETVVVIPLDDLDGGTVAIIVHEDGTEEIIKWSVADDGKLYIPVDGDVTVKIVQNGKRFDDEDDAVWAKDAIAFVTARELFLGTSDTEFAPNLAMSRGMLATVLYRLEGEPEVGENPFEDVEAGEYYEDPITWAEANGVVKGTGGNFFSPKNDITREELAAMLHRYAGEPEAEADMSHFPDADDISDWAEEAMTWALAEGIITGKDGNMAEPGSNATRAEVATMLQRYVMAVR